MNASYRALRVLLATLLSSVLWCVGGLASRGQVVQAASGVRFALTPVVPVHPPLNYTLIETTPGHTIACLVRVTNLGDRAGDVTLTPVDGLTGQTTGLVFTDPAVPQHEVGAWIALAPTPGIWKWARVSPFRIQSRCRRKAGWAPTSGGSWRRNRLPQRHLPLAHSP